MISCFHHPSRLSVLHFFQIHFTVFQGLGCKRPMSCKVYCVSTQADCNWSCVTCITWCPARTTQSYVYQTCKLSVKCRMYALQSLCGVSNVSRSLGCSRPYRVSCNHITTCLCVYTRPRANPLKLRSAQHGSSACTTLCDQRVQVIQSEEVQHFTTCNMPLI